MPITNPYECPFIGQKFQQIHDRPNFQGKGGRIKYGFITGLETTLDTDGNVVSWRAVIECGFSNPDRISSGTGWNTPSMWHPAPVEVQSNEDAIRMLRDQLDNAVAVFDKFREAPGMRPEVDAALAAIQSLTDKITVLEASITTSLGSVIDRLDVLEEPSAPVPPPPPNPDPPRRRGVTPG